MQKWSAAKMLLQRFINYFSSRCCLPALVVCLSLLAGCGSMPSGSSATEAGQAAGSESAESRVIPPQVQTLYEQAVASMAAGDDMDASLRFQEFLLQYPDYSGAHVNLAIIHARNGDDAAVEASITDALILDPLQPQALNQLGMLLRRQGNFEAAENAYLKAVTADPDYALAHYNLGVLNDLYFQRLDAALQHYERYQEIAGEDKLVMRWIADLKRRVTATQRSANVTE
jgi:tetratricopeptide (TPR) repeat protein